MSAASGAGAYSKPVAGVTALASVVGEVVKGLVSAFALFDHLQQHIVEQARRAEPQEVRREPGGAERLRGEDEVGDGLLGRADAARRFETDPAAGFAVEVADRLEHHQGDG